MKKKAIKIAASTAVAASAFVAAAPAAQQADAATNVNQLITDAQNAATVLRWAVSVDGSADVQATYKDQPWAEYNAAKNALAKAEAALKGLSASEKLSASAKLVDVKIQLKRGMHYLDTITTGVRTIAENEKFNALVTKGDLDAITAQYHKVSFEFNKQTKLNYLVYGVSTREEILKHYKLPIEKNIRQYANEVTIHMLATAAAADVKAGKTVEAAAKIAEAQVLLDANKGKLKWEDTLKKSVSDVATALPLTVLSVSRVNDTTLTVSLNKPVDAVYTSDFVFDKGLVVSSAVLSADKKTVTLTTSKQVTDTVYTLTYKGTSKSFSSAASVPGNITVDQNEVYADSTQSIIVEATFKDDNGKLNLAPVTLAVDAGIKVVSVNGIATTSDTVFVPNSSGKLTLVVQATNNAATVNNKEITFTQGTETQKSAKINFYAATPLNVVENDKIIFVDKTNNFFIVDRAGSEFKVKYKDGDVFQLAGSPSNLDAFETKLSKNDAIIGTYSATTSGSVFNLHFDAPEVASFDVNEDTTVRVDSTHVAFTGTGEVGKIVAVYGNNDNFVGQTVINSNGTWSLELPVASAKAGVYSFVYHTDLTKPVPTKLVGSANATRTLEVGEFLATTTFAPSTPDASLNGETITFSTTGDSVTFGDVFKLDNNATITLVDGDGTIVTFTNRVDGTVFSGVDTRTLTVKMGYTAAAGGSIPGLTGTLTIKEVNGVKNEDGLKLKTSKFNNVSGY